MHRPMAAVALLACNACVYAVPRNAVIGQTAAPLGSGTAEVGLSAGLAWTREGPSSTTTGSSGSATDHVMLPNLDGNLTVGLSDLISLNIHGGNVGFQPGAIIHLPTGDFSVAVQPQFGIGYMHSGTAGTSSGNIDYVLVSPGLHVLASHTSGVFAGLGYAFEYINYQGSSSSSTSASSGNYQEHQLFLGVGYEASVGVLRLRPEVSFILIPARSVSSSGTTQSYKDVSFALCPTLTIAVRAKGR
jgi:hypothetical protein